MSFALVLDLESKADVAFLTANDDLLFRELRAPSNYKDPDKIRDYIAGERAKLIEKAALSPLLGRIVAISYASLNDDAEPICIASDDERALLTGFCTAVNEFLPRHAIWCGFNVREFDLPFLALRLAIHGMEWPGIYPQRNDYWRIVDPCDINRHGGNLDMHLRAFGLPPKTADGSQVAGMTIEQIATYCAEDVSRERLLIRRLAHLFPSLNKKES